MANRTCAEEWKENFRMSRCHFLELCERLRPRLTGQNTNMRDALPVETKVAATLYYLADESKYRKVCKRTVTALITIDLYCSKSIRSTRYFLDMCID